jgi:hypothetical protein
LTASEQQWLDQVKANFLYQLKYPLHEEVVKLVLSPLLSLAGLYRHPFQLKAEQPIELAVESKEEAMCGVGLMFWYSINVSGSR